MFFGVKIRNDRFDIVTKRIFPPPLQRLRRATGGI